MNESEVQPKPTQIEKELINKLVLSCFRLHFIHIKVLFFFLLLSTNKNQNAIIYIVKNL